MSKSLTAWISNLIESLLGIGNAPQSKKNKSNLRHIMGPKIAQVLKVYEPLHCILVSDKINYIQVFLSDALIQKLGSQFKTQTFKFSSVRLKSFHLTTTHHASADRDFYLARKYCSLPFSIYCDDLELMSGPDNHIMGDPRDVNRDEHTMQLIHEIPYEKLCKILAQAQFALNQLPGSDGMLYDLPDYSIELPTLADCHIDTRQQAILNQQTSYDMREVITQSHEKNTARLISDETQTEENENQFVFSHSVLLTATNETQVASDDEGDGEDGKGMDLLGAQGKMIIGGHDVFHSDHSTSTTATNTAKAAAAATANSKKKPPTNKKIAVAASAAIAAAELMTQTASQDDGIVTSAPHEVVMTQCSQSEGVEAEPVHRAKQKSVPASQTADLSQAMHEALMLSQQVIQCVPDSQSPPEIPPQAQQQMSGIKTRRAQQLIQKGSESSQSQSSVDKQVPPAGEQLPSNLPSTTRFTRQQLTQRSFQVPSHLLTATGAKAAVTTRGKALEGRKLLRSFNDGKAPQRGYIKRFLTPTYRLVWSDGTEATNYFFEIENWIVADDIEKVNTANWGMSLPSSAPIATPAAIVEDPADKIEIGHVQSAGNVRTRRANNKVPAAAAATPNTLKKMNECQKLHNELNAILDTIDEQAEPVAEPASSFLSLSSDEDDDDDERISFRAVNKDAKKRKVAADNSLFARDLEEQATYPQMLNDNLYFDEQAVEKNDDEGLKHKPAGKKRAREDIMQASSSFASPLKTLRQQQAKKVSSKKLKHEPLKPATEIIEKILQALKKQKRVVVRGSDSHTLHNRLFASSPSMSHASWPRPLNVKQPVPAPPQQAAAT